MADSSGSDDYVA